MPTTPRNPDLHAGDRLTRDEFERRYAAMPNLEKTELIEGVVYMGSPVSHVRHGGPVVHRVDDGEIDWFVLSQGNVTALLAGDLIALRAAVEQGCRVDDHTRFRQRLQP